MIPIHPPVASIVRAWNRFTEALNARGEHDPVTIERWGEYILARGMHWHD